LTRWAHNSPHSPFSILHVPGAYGFTSFASSLGQEQVFTARMQSLPSAGSSCFKDNFTHNKKYNIPGIPQIS